MARFSAAILLRLGLCVAGAGRAWASDPADRCFPWQEFRNGACTAKQGPAPPAPTPAVPDPNPPPAPAEISSAPPPLVCPASFHAEGGVCILDLAPALAPPAAVTTIACNGGTASGGQCTCPADFQLMPAGTDAGGTCVRANADNCLGGQMTVAGECLCIGQVTMSGQVYDLEFAHGKCVPKRCPRDGACVTTAATAKPEADSAPKLASEDRPHGCGHGMVATRHGCVPMRHRSHATDLGDYFRMHY